MNTKTLYEILGVSPTATSKELQKAFRQLSKTLHPDLNDAEDAAEKFAQVKEAYEILSDDDLRKRYDKKLAGGDSQHEKDATFNDIFSAFFNNQASGIRPVRGENIEVTLHVTVEEILRSATKSLNLKKRKTCDECEGAGILESKGKCRDCKGKGGTKRSTKTPFGSLNSFDHCATCKGTGKATTVKCNKCDGKGTIPETEVFEFQIDPTARFGKTMVFKHKGNAGTEGGETGDLRVLLLQSEYDKAEVVFDVDVKERKFIPLKKILQGNPYQVIFPDGTSEEVQLSEEVNKGNMLVFADKGLYDDNGNRGFYNLEVTIDFPELTRLQRHQILTALGDD